MMTRRRNQNGDSLLEIIIAVVIIGLVVSAFFASYSTATKGSTAHRALVTADGVLRSYAEATKAAVRNQCSNGGSTFTVTFSRPGFTLGPSLTAQPCPPSTTASMTASQPWAPIVLTVTNAANGKTVSLPIVVRSP